MYIGCSFACTSCDPLVHHVTLLSCRAMAGDTSLAEHYAFCGMEHIFEKQAGSG